MTIRTIGEIHPPDTSFVNRRIGNVEDHDKVSHEFSLDIGGPIVRSMKTKKWFTLSWRDILQLAKAAGIDEPIDSTTQPKRRRK